ncbi:uncharacterized protein LOC108631841 [Ceratina calcarata]|uniref:Uncharacterized protein LOC108631841 n=1 Tax=Ceratina calcarata TaxID=156304 RepID=A0AAJ7JEB7_9HYME|nr:uncharacterized protein LOC108631841 [Ceratina calcarata]
MQSSRSENETWSLPVNGSVNSNDPWPELCHRTEMKHTAHKKDLANTGESSKPMTLDDFEYPELGDAVINSKNCVALRERCLPSHTLEAVVPIQFHVSEELQRNLRPSEIEEKINKLQETLQKARKLNEKLRMLKINFERSHFGVPNISNTLETNPEFRRVSMTCNMKDKRVLKLKRLTLVHNTKRMYTEKREEFERKKRKAICRDVDTINFNALKITPDPEIDVNYVKNMCTMTLHDKNYRAVKVIGISGDTACHRPGMIQKINNLRIREGRLANRSIENANPSDFSHLDIDVIENDIVKQTLSLRIEDGIKQEIPQIEIDYWNEQK